MLGDFREEREGEVFSIAIVSGDYAMLADLRYALSRVGETERRRNTRSRMQINVGASSLACPIARSLAATVADARDACRHVVPPVFFAH